MSKIKMGRTPTGVNVTLDIYDAFHMLLTGQTRSGKSVQLYAFLAQLPRRGVQVCGVDPTGILFNALGDELGGNDLRVMTLADVERVHLVMARLLKEMDRRIHHLLESGKDKLIASDFSEDLPLLVVVFEEYPGTLAALAALDAASGAKVSERAETRVRAAVQRLALEGAKVGVRLVMVSQRADASLLTGVLRSQLTARFSFRQDPDGLRMLHDTLTPELADKAQSFKPGRAFVEFAGDPKPVIYQADYLDYVGLRARFAAGAGNAP